MIIVFTWRQVFPRESLSVSAVINEGMNIRSDIPLPRPCVIFLCRISYRKQRILTEGPRYDYTNDRSTMTRWGKRFVIPESRRRE